MKQYYIFFVCLLAIILISSCSIGPGDIDTIEEAEQASDILFDAAYSGISRCHGEVNPPDCYTYKVPAGGTIVVCPDEQSAISGSQFYNDLDIEDGIIYSISFSDVDVVHPETGNQYTLNGGLAAYGAFSIGETSFDTTIVIYGGVEIDGTDFSDTAEIDVKYNLSVEFTIDGWILAGDIEGLLNEFDLTNLDWEYTLPL